MFNESNLVEAPRRINETPETESHFLGDMERALVGTDAILQATEEKHRAEQVADAQLLEGEENVISYNKYKKSFYIGNEQVTLGEVIASRHFGAKVAIEKGTVETFEGKRLRKMYTEKIGEDAYQNHTNKILAEKLTEETRKKDMLMSMAYQKIAERTGENNEQMGVLAETMMQGVMEMIAIDRPDLHLVAHGANAYQDVAEKIDFIIATKAKKRGVGVGSTQDVPEEKHFGIQFTINTNKEAHKKEQIEKAKTISDVDDILYVDLDAGTFKKAVEDWKKEGKDIRGPWKHLPKETKAKVLQALLHTVISEEECASVVKNVK